MIFLRQNKGWLAGNNCGLVSMSVREKGSSALTETVALQTKLATVTAPAVDFAVRPIIDTVRV